MARSVFIGATAAATLPAALAASVLVSAPFAGTTTAPLAGGFDARTGHHHVHDLPADWSPRKWRTGWLAHLHF